MLLILCLSARGTVHRGTVARGAAIARDDLRIVFEIVRNDRLAHWFRFRSEAMDSSHANGAEPLHIQRKLDGAKGCDRSCNRPASLAARDDRRIQATP